MLSDEEALTPAEDFYHRLLTIDEQDELEFVEAYLKTNSLSALYDSVFIPVIISTETDHRLELLDDEQRLLIEQSLRDIIEDLGTPPPVDSNLDALKIATEDAPSIGPARPLQVYSLPARADRDELAGAMLIQLLQKEGLVAQSAPANLPVGELLDLVAKLEPAAVCISVVSPSTVIQARYLCVKLKSRFPGLKIVVGLWGLSHGVTEATKRLRESGANEIVTSLNDAVVQLTRNATKVPERMIAEPVSEDVKRSASPNDLQPKLDCSQTKNHSSETHVDTTVNDR